MMKIIVSLMFILILPVKSPAAPIEFIKDYTYKAGDADSLLYCRVVSLTEVKRLLLEELGTYLESNTKIENYKLKKDQITILTGGIVKTELIEEKWNGRTYWLKARIKSDPEDIINKIDELKKNNKLDEKLKELYEQYTDANERIDDLKLKLEDAQKNLLKLNQDYEEAVKYVSAAKMLDKGIQLRLEGEDIKAINSFNSGLKANPTYGLYVERGRTYLKMKRFNEAINDFDSAIDLNPNYMKAYYFKGIALIKKGERQKGINLIEKSAEGNFPAAILWLKANNIS
jgi:tetratricopeptide (TPR) repeat protein